MKTIITMFVVAGVLMITGAAKADFVGFVVDVPAAGGVFGHNSGIPGEVFPADFSDSFAYFGDIKSVNKVMANPYTNGWVVYVYEAPTSRTMQSIEFRTDVYKQGSAIFAVYWSIGNYDGTTAPDPDNDTQWVDLGCNLYRTYANVWNSDSTSSTARDSKLFAPNNSKVYLAFYLENNSSTDWYLQLRQASVEIVPVPATIALLALGILGFLRKEC